MMDDGSQNIYVRRLKVVLLLSSLVSLALLLLSAFQENVWREWRQHQKAYRTALIEHAPDPTARQVAERLELQIQQVFLPDLKRVDRCVICHLGIDNPTQATAAQPLRTHSSDILAHHPVEKFGCTVCHDGQGRGIDKKPAHGEVAHWPAPLLRGEAVYTSCGRCHYENDLYGAEYDLYTRGGPLPPLEEEELNASVPGATDRTERAIGRGKMLVLASGCLGCHRFRERGGTLGPDITYVGDKTPHDFDFLHVQDAHSVEEWLFEHFKKPGQVMPGTPMPNTGLSDAQARDLTQYMLSLHRKSMPASYTPVPSRRRMQPASGEQLFAIFCSACHGQQGQGNPDLPEALMTPAINSFDALAVASDDYLRYTITNGRRDTSMLGWRADEGGLLPAEIDRVVAYIRGWEGPGPVLESISARRGNAQRGQELYQTHCQSCHGPQGEGGIGVTLRAPWFLAVASDRFLSQTIVYGLANTAMPSWKHLTAEEVSDLLAYIRSWQPAAPEKEAVLAKLTTSASPLQELENGRRLFQDHCVSCHGSQGAGDLGPSLHHEAFLSIVNDAYLYDAIVLGRPGTAMPAWTHLSVDEVADLIRYIRSWHGAQHRELEPYSARGDWTRGQLLFENKCASCHGSHGEGVSGAQLNNPVFLASANDAMLRHWIYFGMPGTEMPAYGLGQPGIAALTPTQMEDIVTFLRHLEHAGRTVNNRISPGLVTRGAEVYALRCARCHGANGEGHTGSALSNPDFLRAASDGFLQAAIVLGYNHAGMLPVEQGAPGAVELSTEDVNHVAAFIRNWERQPPTSRIPARYVTGADIADGQALYAENCASCHGDDGKDGWAAALNNGDFLAAATDGFLQATIVRGQDANGMPAFGDDLSGQQINDIVAFLRTWALPGHRPMEATRTQEKTTPTKGTR